MGLLVEGKWQDKWYDTKSTGGRFVRRESQFRDWITADGSSGFKAEPDRYHLYISLACPWAHRTLIFRKLKKLEDIISLSIVDPLMQENGWEFTDYPGSIPDTVNGSHYLYEIYTAAKADYTGRVTVPVLWDKEKNTIVNNESSEIIRMFNSEFNEYGDSEPDFYPLELRDEINRINSTVYDNINNGVYKCGFATSQQAYEEAVNNLFHTLDKIENSLAERRYLVGDKMTEADWRLFTTLLRFDPVYYTHFKCNLRRIEEYPNLSNYLRELYQFPGLEETVNLKHIKEHYFKSHKSINPTGIVPSGPELDLSTPHNRA
ncbi:MAG: glutathione S-transferase family protein [Candidatus Dadabacteria bacterium]|nr:glutathione S-transferase family protein [Candidatus Dadabacteria bacterium]